MARPPLQTNASNHEQIKFAGRFLKREAARRFVLVRQMLATYEGREFLWLELERHGIYNLAQGPVEQIYTFLGRRNAGIELFVELKDQHGAGYLQMQQDAIERHARDNREIEATRTPSATEKKQS